MDNQPDQLDIAAQVIILQNKMSHVAMREHIAELRSEMHEKLGEVNEKFGQVNEKFGIIRVEIADVQANLKAEITDVRTEISDVKNQLHDHSASIVKWIVGSMFGCALGVASLMLLITRTTFGT